MLKIKTSYLATVRLSKQRLAAMVDELCSKHDYFKQMHELAGYPSLMERQLNYESLVQIIIEQSISLKAADRIYKRIRNHYGSISADLLANEDWTVLRTLGLSRAKSEAIIAVAKAIQSDLFSIEALAEMEAKEASKALQHFKGIGPWTSNVFNLMVLLQADVWPIYDRALVVGWSHFHQHEEVIKDKALAKIAEDWKPYRAVAARIIWQYYLHEKRI